MLLLISISCVYGESSQAICSAAKKVMHEMNVIFENNFVIDLGSEWFLIAERQVYLVKVSSKEEFF
jgi:hypothetical protein